MKIGIKKKILSAVLLAGMSFGTVNYANAASASELNNISDNTLVVGQYLFELDSVDSSNYNSEVLEDAEKTVDGVNDNIYYKFDGKWYTSEDIKSLTSLMNAQGKETIENDIVNVNGQFMGSDKIAITINSDTNIAVIKFTNKQSIGKDINIKFIDEVSGRVENVDQKVYEGESCEFDMKYKSGLYRAVISDGESQWYRVVGTFKK